MARIGSLETTLTSKVDFFSIKNVFCLKLDAKSVPEALATSIRILLMFFIVLAHSRAQLPGIFFISRVLINLECDPY